MKSKFIWLFAILLGLGLSSCIDILDEIKLNDDKSGSVFIGIESEMLGSIMNMAKDKIQPKTMEGLESLPIKSKEKIVDIKGVSNVKAFNQINKGRLGISFDFANPKALNSAYYALVDMKKAWYQPNIIKIGKHKISRRDLSPQLVKQIESENPELKNSEFLKYLNMKTVVRLPSISISIEEGEGKELKNTKKVAIRYTFTEILEETRSTAYRIRF
ncbi:MAG: hypothetical protein DRI84_04175 [Bacteroidetes bacterium]|nr:MAG: hypothetical protein DRI84_04175 [Bacteroidota bacterium]